jgi:hypothetical protein
MAGMSARISKQDLTRQLGATVGLTKAEQAIQDALVALHLDGENLDQEDTLQILDHLSNTPNVVGIAARFLKVRALLNFGK